MSAPEEPWYSSLLPVFNKLSTNEAGRAIAALLASHPDREGIFNWVHINSQLEAAQRAHREGKTTPATSAFTVDQLREAIERQTAGSIFDLVKGHEECRDLFSQLKEHFEPKGTLTPAHQLIESINNHPDYHVIVATIASSSPELWASLTPARRGGLHGVPSTQEDAESRRRLQRREAGDDGSGSRRASGDDGSGSSARNAILNAGEGARHAMHAVHALTNLMKEKTTNLDHGAMEPDQLEEAVNWSYDDDDDEGEGGGMQLATQDDADFGGGGGFDDDFGNDDDEAASRKSGGTSKASLKSPEEEEDDDDEGEESPVPEKKRKGDLSEEDEDGSEAPLEEEAGEAEYEDDDSSIDGGWRFDAEVWEKANDELQRVVGKGIDMDGISSVIDLGYSKYSPHTLTENTSGLYVSLHEERGGSFLIIIGKATRDTFPRNTRKGPLDMRVHAMHTCRGRYGMVKLYTTPSALGLPNWAPALESMLKKHLKPLKGKECTGTETFEVRNKTLAIRCLRRIDCWILQFFDERRLTIPASAVKMEGGKQICFRLKDEDVDQSVYHFKNRKGLGIAVEPIFAADDLQDFFAPMSFDEKVNYLQTDQGKRDAKRQRTPIVVWKEEMRSKWKKNCLTSHQTDRLISIGVFRDSAMHDEYKSDQMLRKRQVEIDAFQSKYLCQGDANTYGKYPDPSGGRWLTNDERDLGKSIQSCVDSWRRPKPYGSWKDVEEYAKLYRSRGIAEFERKPVRKKGKRGEGRANVGKGRVYTKREQKWMAKARERSIFTRSDYQKWKDETNAPDPIHGLQFIYPAGDDSGDEIVLFRSPAQRVVSLAMAKLVEDEELGNALKNMSISSMMNRFRDNADRRWNGLWIRSYEGTDNGWCAGSQAEAAKREWINSIKQKAADAPAIGWRKWNVGTARRPTRKRKATEKLEYTTMLASGQRR